MLYIRQAKEIKREKAKRLQGQAEVAPLQQAWNQERVRAGDYVGGQGGRDEEHHANMWPVMSVQTSAWRQIGSASKTIRSGVDAMSKELAVLAVMSAASHDAQAT